MTYRNNNRNAKSAVERKKFMTPVRIDDGVALEGEGIFLKKCLYNQYKNGIVTPTDTYESWYKSYFEQHSQSYSEWSRHKRALCFFSQIQADKGRFYQPKDLETRLPCIDIIQEDSNVYRIKWFDSGMGLPRRKGGNEDLYRKGTRMCGRPNTLNETAFILKEGESGILKYNYRCTYMEGGHYYKCYYVYVVNETVLSRNVFLRSYQYEYNQLASLF